MKTELEPHCRHIRLIADSGDAAESIILTAEESHADLAKLRNNSDALKTRGSWGNQVG